MTQTLLVIPTSTESEAIIARLKMDFVSDNFYRNDANSVDLLISGAGMPAFVINLSLHLAQYKYDRLILCGIAGSYSKNIDLGQLVYVQSETFADLGALENNSISYFFNFDDWKKDYMDGKMINNSSNPLFTDIVNVASNSVNLCNAHGFDMRAADIENMEGAAFFMYCRKVGVEYHQIRAISNYAGERNKSNWKIGLAITNLADYLAKRIFNEE